MAVNLRVLVPDGTTNYVENPSLRYDATGYTAVGSALSRTLDQARYNIASLKVDTNGISLYEGCYYRVNSLSGTSEPIAASAYVRGTGIVRIRLIDNPSGKQWYSQPVYLVDRWTRVSVSGYSTGSDDLRIYIETDQRAQDTVFYVDGVQLERKAYPTTFCDGDQPGCRWTGMYNAGTSTRSPYTRQGGRWVDLAGPCRADDNIYVTILTGLGMMPKSSQRQSWALEPGSYFQNSKVLDRTITLAFHVKNPTRVFSKQNDLSPIHYLRQQLIDIFKPDRVYDSEELVFEYQDGDKPLYFKGLYESGLEGEWDIRNGMVNSFAVTLRMVNPSIYEDNQDAVQLTIQKSYDSGTRLAKIIAKINGRWSLISEDGSGFWDSVSSVATIRDVAFGIKGEVYFCGLYVYQWNGNTMEVIGTPNSGGLIAAMDVAPNGDIYVIGSFTSINGVAAARIAKWNGSAWSALGSGLTGLSGAEDVIVAQNGHVYVGGQTLSQAGGVPVQYIARWNGGSWTGVGIARGLSHGPFAFARGIDKNTLYVVGQFTCEDPIATGQDLNRAAKISLDTNTFSPLGDGLGPDGTTAVEVAVAKDGAVFVVGSFTTSGTEAVNKIAFWNGTGWFQLGSELSSEFLSNVTGLTTLALDPTTGDIYFAYRMNDFYGIRFTPVMKWVGDRRTHGNFALLDFYIVTNTAIANSIEISKIRISPAGDIYIIGYDTVGSSGGGFGRPILVSGITTVVNRGTISVAPRFYFRGPGIIRNIENLTTGKVLPVALTVLNGEEITIDCSRASIRSAVRGDLSSNVIPIGSIGDFRLSPGENEIAMLITDDAGFLAQITFVPEHVSSDATAKIGALA